MTLVVAPCNHKAAQFAVDHWHYSRTMPAGARVRYGVWEDDRFIGAVIFARGANKHLGDQFGLDTVELAELARVALRDHRAPVSQIVMRATDLLRQANPGLRLLVSFADPVHGHHGGIYQAMSWTYTGTSNNNDRAYLTRDGRVLHKRVVSVSGYRTQFGRLTRVPKPGPDLKMIRIPGKHRYVLPLDRAMRRQVSKLAKPYPPAAEASAVTRSRTA